jgi:orotidine-5'-phosphate decarboxylase
VSSGEAWSGKLLFDTQRHKAMRLPADYPRLNHWPEWFTVTPGARYNVTVGSRKPATLDGAALAAGLQLEVAAGRPLTVRVEPVEAAAR